VVSHTLCTPSAGANTTAHTTTEESGQNSEAKEQGSWADEGNWGFKIAVHSVHGQRCSMPMVGIGKG